MAIATALVFDVILNILRTLGGRLLPLARRRLEKVCASMAIKAEPRPVPRSALFTVFRRISTLRRRATITVTRAAQAFLHVLVSFAG